MGRRIKRITVILTIILGLTLLITGGLFFLFVCEAGEVFFEGAEAFSLSEQPWQECEIFLPEAEVRLLFLRRRAHPVLIEYDRKIVIDADREDGMIVLELPVNPGGETGIDVYLRTEGLGTLVELRDRWGGYIVDIENLELRSTGGRAGKPRTTAPRKGVLVGRIEAGKGRPVFIPRAGHPGDS
jgi:hypothetical protein